MTGSHQLWMSAGGSSGHSGLWSLDIKEGRQRDPGGRCWSVRVETASESRRSAREERERRKQDRATEKLDEHVSRLRSALVANPAGETKKQLRLVSRLNQQNFDVALQVLADRNDAEICTVTKNGRKQPGYRPAPTLLAA